MQLDDRELGILYNSLTSAIMSNFDEDYIELRHKVKAEMVDRGAWTDFQGDNDLEDEKCF